MAAAEAATSWNGAAADLASFYFPVFFFLVSRNITSCLLVLRGTWDGMQPTGHGGGQLGQAVRDPTSTSLVDARRRLARVCG
jgi:hypothetical protein